MKWLALYLINVYQKQCGSRRLMVDCNFEPSCSSYAKEAIEKHGLTRGFKFAIGRLSRCNEPDNVLVKFDPVPEKQT